MEVQKMRREDTDVQLVSKSALSAVSGNGTGEVGEGADQRPSAGRVFPRGLHDSAGIPGARAPEQESRIRHIVPRGIGDPDGGFIEAT